MIVDVVPMQFALDGRPGRCRIAGAEFWQRCTRRRSVRWRRV
jgi:hypothetical protein